MFDLKLTDVFSTLCIGVLTLALVTYFYFIFNKFFVKNKFDTDVFNTWVKDILKDNYKENGYMILALVAVYCLGVIAGDLTGRMTDSDSSHKTPILLELKWISQMKSQEDTRKEAIVDTANGWKLTSIGNSALRSQSIVNNANHISGTNFLVDTNHTFDEKFHSLNAILTRKGHKQDSVRTAFRRFLQQIYYTGKNWCFSKDHEPLNELKSIQNRIDLSRSIVLLLTFSMQVLLLIVLSNLFYVAWLGLKEKPQNWKFWRKSDFNGFFYLLQINPVLIFLTLLLVSKDCYNINEDNYNKRAYGYYVSEINRLEYLKSLKGGEEKKKDPDSTN